MNTIKRVLSQGFRAFFLSAGLFGLFAGTVWVLWLADLTARGDTILGSVAMAPPSWHAHEMIFGYASAAIAGFLLTAVPNWTGGPGARGLFVVAVTGVWLAGRLALWFSGSLPPVLVAVADLAFVPVLAAQILSQLIRRPKPQNMMFLLFLTLFWISNLMVHLDWIGLTADTRSTGLRGGLIVLVALISVLGGRVTPAFTRNAMRRENAAEADLPHSRPLVEKLSLGLALLLPAVVLAGAPNVLTGSMAVAMGVVQGVRLSGWRGIWAWRQPILFALHLALAMLALGLILWGAATLGLGNETAALHVLGIGGVGGMTMAVMSRAALGHSGRALVAPRPVVAGYGLIAVAALLRWAGSGLSGDLYQITVISAGIFWVLGFLFFVSAMWPALTGPRLGSDS